MKYILIAILIICLFASCKDEYNICTQPKTVRFIGGFYQKINGADVPTATSNLTITNLNGTGNIYSNQPNIISATIPLNDNVDSAKYQFTLADNLPKDTVTIIYTTQTAFTSAECGAIFNHTITKIRTTINTIDSIKIINPSINTSLAQNVNIYF